jgi:hypothetical protein
LFALAAAVERGDVRERALAGLRASWLALLLVAGFVALRQSVLGGLGGGPRTSLEGGVSGLDTAVRRYSELLLSPLAPSWMPGGAFAVAIGTAAVVFLVYVLARVRSNSRATTRSSAAPVR